MIKRPIVQRLCVRSIVHFFFFPVKCDRATLFFGLSVWTVFDVFVCQNHCIWIEPNSVHFFRAIVAPIQKLYEYCACPHFGVFIALIRFHMFERVQSVFYCMGITRLHNTSRPTGTPFRWSEVKCNFLLNTFNLLSSCHCFDVT